MREVEERILDVDGEDLGPQSRPSDPMLSNHERTRLLGGGGGGGGGAAQPLLRAGAAGAPSPPAALHTSASSPSSSPPAVLSIAILRSLTRSRAFSVAQLPWLPPSRVPRVLFPLTRLRHRVYLALSHPWTSRVGIAFFWLTAAAILAFVVAFSLESLPENRLRAVRGDYGLPERCFDAVDVAVVAVFAAGYLLRLFCVTAVPDGGEERALAAMAVAAKAAAAAGGSGGGGGGGVARRARCCWCMPRCSRGGSGGGSGREGSLAGGRLDADLAFAFEDADEDGDDGDAADSADATARRWAAAAGADNGAGHVTPPPREFDVEPAHVGLDGTGLGISTLFDLDSLRALRWVDESGAAGVAPGEPPPLMRTRWCAPAYLVAVLRRGARRLFWWQLNVYNLIELMCGLPFFVDFISEDVLNDRRAAPLRVARFLCLLRLLRLTSDSTGMRLLGRAVLSSADTLRGSFFLAAISAVFFAMGIFLCEQGSWDAASQQWRRPTVSGVGDEVSPFSSVSVAAWFTIVTMTTVGYGDMTPTSTAGRALCVCCIVVGVLVLAVPATIVGFNLAVELEKYKARAEARLRAKLAQRQRALALSGAGGGGNGGNGQDGGAGGTSGEKRATAAVVSTSAQVSDSGGGAGGEEDPEPTLRSLTGLGAAGTSADLAAEVEGLRADMRDIRRLLGELLQAQQRVAR